MNAYWAVWKLRFIAGMQYRAAAAAGMLTQLFFGLSCCGFAITKFSP